MVEPLIVVEGNLRLPAVRPLTDPSLNFGLEWTPAPTRPVQSQSEVPLLAARLHTTYMPALHVPDSRAPYRAVSLWSVYTMDGMPRAALDLIAGQHAAGRAEETPVDPIRLAVDAPAPVFVPAARRRFISQPVAMAIAAGAGAIFIAWLLFGYDGHFGSEKRSVASTQIAEPARPNSIARPAAEPASAPVTIARVDADASARPAPVRSATAVTPSVETKAAKLSSANAGGRIVAAQAHPRKAAKQAEKQAEPARRTAKKRKNATAYAWAEPTEPGHMRHGRAERTAHTVRTTRAVDSRHLADERVAGVESSWRARTTSSYNERIQTPKASGAMSPEALYALLQHSPTLDNNAPTSGARTTRTGGASGH
ncbi:hypothetical protein AWB71_02890 [Caballeronia peredens]|nr:hypothetical protein AWB71_02890 [Caballeronia peredens]